MEIQDFSTTSSRCAIYAISDDYSGMFLTNPMLPDEYRNVVEEKVVLEKHTIIGTGSTILPGCILGEGTAVGSMSLVNKSLDPWGIYVGVPCRKIKDRKKNILEFEKAVINGNITDKL